MTRNLKFLGLAILAALATSSLVTLSGSSAQTGGHFDSEISHTTISGEQKDKEKPHKFNFEGFGFIECEEAVLHGTTLEAKVTQITLEPSYSKCKNGSNHVTVTTNGCAYVFTFGPQLESHSTVHIECPAKKKIEIHVRDPANTKDLCTISVGPQTPLNGVVFTNEGSPHDVKAEMTLNDVSYTRHKGECDPPTTTTLNNGQITGTTTIRGFNTVGQQKAITATGAS
jgi:hypothetical protein